MIVFIVALVIGIPLGILYRKKVAEKEILSAEEEAKRIINEAIKSAESKKREALVEAKEKILAEKTNYEREAKERRSELQEQERRLQQKEETLERKLENVERKEESYAARLANLEEARTKVAKLQACLLYTSTPRFFRNFALLSPRPVVYYKIRAYCTQSTLT